jgi:hypothetical protein
MNKSEIIIYSTDDGLTKIQTRLENDTVWLTQAQMAELFAKDRTVITKHIANVFKNGELIEKSNVQNLHVPNSDKPVKFYNLDVIISVGYRVKSHQGTKFRQWATARLREYIVKGFTMNDELLKEAGSKDYFEELLNRIRNIRSSEKVFWRKVLDIYSTSVDYDPKSEKSILFFQTIQNKMHWAAHGHTAAEIIYQRINAKLPNMGLTNFKGTTPTKEEIEIAKNYLNEDELNILNRIVTGYLDLAEIQALNRKPMYMSSWIEKLDEFIKITGNEILQHSGTISHQKAIDRANDEYLRYKEMTKNDLSVVEKHFIDAIENTNRNLNG